MTCPDEAELLGFVSQHVSAERRRDIEGHFDQCADCRELVFALATQSEGAGENGAALGTGASLGRFVIEEKIAEGAMGMIYRAHDPTLRRDVALKLLRVGGAARDEAHARMLREAQGLAQLEHENVVTVYETGVHAGEVFIAMELIAGVSLDRWLRAQRRGWREIASVLAHAGRGLAAAHAVGLVHRDFKPANIMIGNDRRVKVVDFGLARAIAEAMPRDGAQFAATSALTATGTLVGTPAYCAPEQLAGYEVDTASDVFAFCVTCCEAFFGRRPYEAATASDLLARMGDPRGPTLPRTPRLPARLRALLRRGLAFDPKERPALPELIAALGDHSARRRIVLAAAATLAIAAPLTVLAATSARGEEPCTRSRDELASIWNAERRTQIRSALLATQLPFAATTWPYVERALDRYAERWVATHADACRATAIRRTQSPELLDRRMTCLASRRASLDATISALGQTDRSSAREALRVVDSIPSIAACNDATSLLALAPEPSGAAATAELARLRQLLARSSALKAAGKYQPAFDVAREAVTLAERLDYKPLYAEALFARGTAEAQLKRLDHARASYEAASWAAAASGHTRIEAQALAELALLLRDQSPDGRVALTHASHALALVERTSGDPLLEAKMRLAKARAIYTIDHDAGLREYALGRARLDEAAKLDPEATRLLRIDFEILHAEASDRPDQALPRLTALLAETEKWFGPEHPTNAVILWEMAESAAMLDRHDEAHGYAKRVARLLAPYPDHDVLLRRFEADLEPDPVKRRPLFEALIADLERFYGPTSPQVGISLLELADTLLELEQPQEALPHIDRAIEIWRGAYGSRFQLFVHAYATRSQILYALGDVDRAVESAEKSIEAAQRTTVSPGLTLFARLMLAEQYFRTGRYAETLPQVAYVREHAALLPGGLEEFGALELEFVEAACQWKVEHDPAALRRARDVHARYRVHPQADRPSIKDQAAWLAKHGR